MIGFKEHFLVVGNNYRKQLPGVLIIRSDVRFPIRWSSVRSTNIGTENLRGLFITKSHGQGTSFVSSRNSQSELKNISTRLF